MRLKFVQPFPFHDDRREKKFIFAGKNSLVEPAKSRGHLVLDPPAFLQDIALNANRLKGQFPLRGHAAAKGVERVQQSHGKRRT